MFLNSISTIKNLIELFEKFTKEENSKDKSLTKFSNWLSNFLFVQMQEQIEPNHSPEIEITFLITLINRQYKNQTKKALLNSEISNADSYLLLYHLFLTDSFRKMELISLIQLEAPTGIEIIKRLLSKKLILEFADSKDRRAKRIQITKKGIEEVKKLNPTMNKIYLNMTKKLDKESKNELLFHLLKMNNE